jgi:hypothetical protein
MHLLLGIYFRQLSGNLELANRLGSAGIYHIERRPYLGAQTPGGYEREAELRRLKEVCSAQEQYSNHRDVIGRILGAVNGEW